MKARGQFEHEFLKLVDGAGIANKDQILWFRLFFNLGAMTTWKIIDPIQRGEEITPERAQKQIEGIQLANDEIKAMCDDMLNHYPEMVREWIADLPK